MCARRECGERRAERPLRLYPIVYTKLDDWIRNTYLGGSATDPKPPFFEIFLTLEDFN